MKPDRRGSWYLLTGVVIGAAVGLVYSWVVSPVRYVDAPPSALRADYKDDYRLIVAFAYQYSHDLLRAEGRLAQLKDDGPAQAVALQAERAMAEGASQQEVEALNTLAEALGGNVSPQPVINSPEQLASFTPGSNDTTLTPLIIKPSATMAITPEITSTFASSANFGDMTLLRIATSTPHPSSTATPSPTPGAPFVLQETRLVCNIRQAEPLIQVELRDAAGQPVPSVEILVAWEGGADHFFTGLQPEVSLGYGDFVMTPGITYSIQPAGGSQPVSDLTASECKAEDGSQFWGSWYLVFVQP